MTAIRRRKAFQRFVVVTEETAAQFHACYGKLRQRVVIVNLNYVPLEIVEVQFGQVRDVVNSNVARLQTRKIQTCYRNAINRYAFDRRKTAKIKVL